MITPSRSIRLLKRIIETPNLFHSPEVRGVAKKNLQEKLERRDRKIKKATQTNLFDDGDQKH